MKPRTEADVKRELEICIRSMKALMMELEPSERLRVTNEVFLRLMPDRQPAASAADKAAAQKKSPAPLTDSQKSLIRHLSQKTDELFDIDGGDHRA